MERRTLAAGLAAVTAAGMAAGMAETAHAQATTVGPYQVRCGFVRLPNSGTWVNLATTSAVTQATVGPDTVNIRSGGIRYTVPGTVEQFLAACEAAEGKK